MKRCLTACAGLTLILTLGGGCAAPDNTTPLAHHAKNLSQHDFDAASISWDVDNGEGLRMHADAEWVYMQFSYSVGEEGKYIQFIIDSDDNTATGNRVENGADYIVENGYLYRSKQRDAWDWEELGKVDSVTEEGRDTVRIRKSDMPGLSPHFSVNAEVLNARLKPILYSPEAMDAEGNHLKTRYTTAN